MTDLRKSGHKFSTTHKFFLKDDIPENRLIFSVDPKKLRNFRSNHFLRCKMPMMQIWKS